MGMELGIHTEIIYIYIHIHIYIYTYIYIAKNMAIWGTGGGIM